MYRILGYTSGWIGWTVLKAPIVTIMHTFHLILLLVELSYKEKTRTLELLDPSKVLTHFCHPYWSKQTFRPCFHFPVVSELRVLRPGQYSRCQAWCLEKCICNQHYNLNLHASYKARHHDALTIQSRWRSCLQKQKTSSNFAHVSNPGMYSCMEATLSHSITYSESIYRQLLGIFDIIVWPHQNFDCFIVCDGHIYSYKECIAVHSIQRRAETLKSKGLYKWVQLMRKHATVDHAQIWPNWASFEHLSWASSTVTGCMCAASMQYCAAIIAIMKSGNARLVLKIKFDFQTDQ